MFLAVLDEYCGAPAAPAPPRLGGDRASSGRAAETADAGVALGGGCDTFTFSPDVARAAVGALAAGPPPRPAAGTCAKRGEYGSAEDRWASRCTVEAIQIDQANGCTVACGCVQRLSLAEIQDQRTQRMNERGAGRREFLRTYFEHNRNLECRFGYELHTQDASKRILCTTGFAVYHGFTVSFLYDQRKRFNDGDRADDPNLGGYRRGAGAASGDAFADDSVQFQAMHGWLLNLWDDTEAQPNSRLRQLDYIEKNELYDECVGDLTDAGSPLSIVGSFVSGRARARSISST